MASSVREQALNLSTSQLGGRIEPSFQIESVIRPLRGGSQSRLVRCSDGNHYVCKFGGNPQGNRTLVNEIIAHRILVHLGISTAKIALLNLPDELGSEIRFTNGKSPQGDVHFGSRCPVNPQTTVIFDFLPATLLSRVRNLDEFAAMFVFDLWASSNDKRQSVFSRSGTHQHRCAMKATFIDHGKMFGPAWELGDVARQNLAMHPQIYDLIDMRALTEQTISRIAEIPSEIFDEAVANLPTSWLAPGEQSQLTALMGQLSNRRSKLGQMVKRRLVDLAAQGIGFRKRNDGK